jgi:hypothetical protein
MSRRFNSQAEQALTAYLEWKQQSIAVGDAYSRWSAARRADLQTTYLAYADALDGERRASEAYADVLRCAQPLPATPSLAA